MGCLRVVYQGIHGVGEFLVAKRLVEKLGAHLLDFEAVFLGAGVSRHEEDTQGRLSLRRNSGEVWAAGSIAEHHIGK
jgi:hypothetical protein